MRQAGAEYLAEEGRYRGARPRVKAVLYPFDLDYGLAPGSGVFEHTEYGGEPGKLIMAAGSNLSGSWLSPVMAAFSPYLDRVAPTWEESAGAMDPLIYLRRGASPQELAGAAFSPLTPGVEVALGPYFQVQVAFQQNIRSWAGDSAAEGDEFAAYALDQAPDGGYESYGGEGETAGYLAGLSLEGRLTLPESEILDAGRVKVDLARDFSGLTAATHALVLDNRRGQWLSGAAGSYLRGQDWSQKQVSLYHGWELGGGTVAWQLVYQRRRE